jgi:hypothetical protein
MPLPQEVRRLLENSIHQVPEEGLFTTSRSPFKDQAFERPDIVSALVNAARRKRLALVLLAYALRRRGKTFIMPWALIEAIRLLEAGNSTNRPPRRPFIMLVHCHRGGL